MQVDLTKERPSHVWLGYDEAQDVNGDGQWLEVQYDNLTSYCTHCRHLGHTMLACPVKLRDFEIQKKKEEEAAAATTSHTITQQKHTEKDESSKQQQNVNQQGKSKKGGQDQSDKPKVVDHQQAEAHQNAVQEIPAEEWQTQRKKNFKGNNQNKKTQQVYIQKQSANQQYQMPTNNAQQSGMISINPPAPLERSADSVAQNHPNPNVPPDIIPADSVAQNPPNPPVPSIPSDVVVDGGKVNCQEIPRTRQDGEPNGVGFPHVLHECANAQLDDPRLDTTSPATTTPVICNNSNPQFQDDEECEVLSSEEDHMVQQSEVRRKTAKGKAHATLDFTLQPHKSKNKPCQKKRQAMRRQASGITINEPFDKSPFQSHVSIMRRPPDLNSADKSQVYKDPSSDPSLSQPLLNTSDDNRNAENDAATPLEECPLNKPKVDDYRPLLSEDEMSGGIEEENEISEASDDDQHYDMLVNAVNGAYQQSETIDAQGLSPRSYNPSPRLTRTSNINNKIWVFWDQDFSGNVIDQDEQQITVELKHTEAAEPFQISVIYAKCRIALRRPLWDKLRAKALSTTIPWCVIGDFNVIASIEEKTGGIPYQINKSMEFLNMIKDCGLSDLGFYGPRQEYRDIFCKVKEFKDKVREAEEKRAQTNNEADRAYAHEITAQYVKHLKTEEAVLKQKTQLQWFKEGDANTKYFHSLVRGRRRNLYIHKIKDDDVDWISCDENIGEAACDHFQSLFSDTGGNIREDLLSFIPSMTSQEDNAILNRDPTIEEIKHIVFSMNPTKENKYSSEVTSGYYTNHLLELVENRCVVKYGGNTSFITRTLYSITSDILLLLKSTHPSSRWPPNWADMYCTAKNLRHHVQVFSHYELPSNLLLIQGVVLAFLLIFLKSQQGTRCRLGQIVLFQSVVSAPMVLILLEMHSLPQISPNLFSQQQFHQCCSQSNHTQEYPTLGCQPFLQQYVNSLSTLHQCYKDSHLTGSSSHFKQDGISATYRCSLPSVISMEQPPKCPLFRPLLFSIFTQLSLLSMSKQG
ncbi:hypothetical protein A4A49_00689 [Nicotiana attenuata]|uniref:DUF4283 domain-containing protein n=1 Tax=Nicotiana attenuata TaxID=49451 RepID=A0A314L6B8_NICAT|nr:hypothetical protein A4A49_00689 [Nicotiana attenuata]